MTSTANTASTTVIRRGSRICRPGEVPHDRGMHVRVVRKDGTAWTGTLTAWGKQIIEIIPTDGGMHGWKRESHPTFFVARVEAVA